MATYGIMKTIKIFLASSSELSEERDKMSMLIESLNERFEPRGIHLKLVKWENLDSSMNRIRKQNEYNDELSKCDICMVLFWNKIGEYTKEELDLAYHNYSEGRRPYKIYVFFKESEVQSEDIADFKKSIESTYGHFYNTFTSSEKLQLDFLLQFELYQNSFDTKISFELKDGAINLDNEEIINIRHLPFCSNNIEYNNVLEDIAEIQEILADSPYNFKLHSRLEKLIRRKADMESTMIDTAKNICKLKQKISSSRLHNAATLFENGDCHGANALLSLSSISNDLADNIKMLNDSKNLLSYSKEAIQLNLDECRLKINTLSIIGGKDSLDEIRLIYATVSEQIYNGLNIVDYIDWVVEYIEHLLNCYQYDILKIELDRLQKKINLNCLPQEYRIKILNAQGYLLTSIGHYAEAENVYNLMLANQKMLSNNQIASIYDNLSSIHLFMRKITEAKVDVQKAIALKNLSGTDVLGIISSTTDFGYLLSHIDEDGEAKQILNWSLERLNTYKSNDQVSLLEWGRALTTIGIVESKLGNNDEAIQNFKKGLKYLIELNMINPYLAAPHLASIFSNLGESYLQLQMFLNAKESFEKSMEIYTNLCEAQPGTYELDTAICISNVASLLESEKQYELAIEKYQESVKLLEECQQMGSTLLALTSTLNNYGYALYKLGKLGEAKTTYLKCIELCKQQDDVVFEKIQSRVMQNLNKVKTVE